MKELSRKKPSIFSLVPFNHSSTMTNSTLKDEELYQRLQQHDHFFHRCVQMIPHELYKHTESLTGYRDDSDEEEEENEDNQANSKYYKHRKQPLTADERKIKSAENKKRKYSSENAKSENAPEEDDDEDGDESIEQEEGGEPIQKKQKLLSGAAAASGDKLDELRKKLQERISSLKQQRETKKPHKLQKQQQQQKQQQANKNKEKEKKNNPPTQKKPSLKPLASNQSEENGGRSVEALENTIDRLRSELLSNKREYSADDDTESKPVSSSNNNQDFEFNQIHQTVTTSADYQKAGIPNAGGTKKQRLQRLLQEAEKKRQRYQQLASSEDPVEKQKLQSEQWNDVLASAAGKKTILVSGTSTGGDQLQMVSKSEIKIKKALKKLEKKKEKSAKEWKDRLDTLDNEKQEKLAKREENIQKYKKHNNNGMETTAESSSSNNNNHNQQKNKPSVKISRPGQSHHKESGGGHNNNNNNHHGGSGGGGQKKPNRAGFEGKKSDGKFLNAK